MPGPVAVDADQDAAAGAGPVVVEEGGRADVTHFTDLGLKPLPEDSS